MESDHNIYIVTEYCNGGDLRGYLKASKNLLSERKARAILIDILQGYRGLWAKRIIHRDLKPENILLHDNVFKLADFGFARGKSETNSIQSVVGTPVYMSPELMKGQAYSEETDIWAFGLIYYEMLFGKLPWQGNTEVVLFDNITQKPLLVPFEKNVSNISHNFIRACLQINPKKR